MNGGVRLSPRTTCRLQLTWLWAVCLGLVAPLVAQGQLIAPTAPYEPGRSIIVGLPTQRLSSRGQLTMTPNVSVVDGSGTPTVLPSAANRTPYTQASFGTPAPSPVPPLPPVPAMPSVPAEPVFSGSIPTFESET